MANHQCLLKYIIVELYSIMCNYVYIQGYTVYIQDGSWIMAPPKTTVNVSFGPNQKVLILNITSMPLWQCMEINKYVWGWMRLCVCILYTDRVLRCTVFATSLPSCRPARHADAVMCTVCASGTCQMPTQIVRTGQCNSANMRLE